MPSRIKLFIEVDSGAGIFRVEYESARILEYREESLESKQAIRRINQKDNCDNGGNTYFIVGYIDYLPNQGLVLTSLS